MLLGPEGFSYYGNNHHRVGILVEVKEKLVSFFFFSFARNFEKKKFENGKFERQIRIFENTLKTMTLSTCKFELITS